LISVSEAEDTTQPPPPSVVQHTTVNIHREMPKDHFIWSLCCFLYSNPFCLGLAALIHSVKARDRKVMGDIEGARAYGTTARTLNIISTVIACLSVLITIIIIAVVLARAAIHCGPKYSTK
uniref:Uncharacterized protein n=1 Tax=Neogobius melanostomus TaxID=47308 RepID=A0A8C6SIX1_9GOBI